jgi:general secretion pathway protein H
MRSQARSAGFTLIEILVVVLIIGIISAGVLLSLNLTGRDHELETETDRLLSLVTYAREQAELQTREYGLIFNDDGYQFVAFDARRGLWRQVYEDESLRLRKLPLGLDFKLIVEARPVVLVPLSQAKPDPKASKPKLKSLSDTVAGLKDATTTGRGLKDDTMTLKDEKPITPQVMIFSNGDLTSFQITVERDGGLRSVTLSQDDKGLFVAKPMVERRT